LYPYKTTFFFQIAAQNKKIKQLLLKIKESKERNQNKTRKISAPQKKRQQGPENSLAAQNKKNKQGKRQQFFCKTAKGFATPLKCSVVFFFSTKYFNKQWASCWEPNVGFINHEPAEKKRNSFVFLFLTLLLFVLFGIANVDLNFVCEFLNFTGFSEFTFHKVRSTGSDMALLCPKKDRFQRGSKSPTNL
jgi:hypothetical protein